VFVRLNCGVRPHSFPRTIDLPASPHPAFYMCPLSDTLALVLNSLDSLDPPNQCQSVLGQNCLGSDSDVSGLYATVKSNTRRCFGQFSVTKTRQLINNSYQLDNSCLLCRCEAPACDIFITPTYSMLFCFTPAITSLQTKHMPYLLCIYQRHFTYSYKFYLSCTCFVYKLKFETTAVVKRLTDTSDRDISVLWPGHFVSS